MSVTPAETVDWDAIASQVIRELLGRRFTFPLMRAVDAYPIARELHLTGRPVQEIHRVTVVSPGSSTVLDPSNYELASRFRLRIAGSVALPYAAYENGRCTSEIYVEYTYGSKPPTAIQQAIDALTDQLELAAVNSEDCRLPKRVTSIVSQGLSMTLLDPQDYLEKGLTGLPEVDAVISAFNPGKVKARSRLFTAKNPPARRISVFPEIDTPDTYNLNITGGARYRRGFQYTVNNVVQDLSGFSWKSEIRESESSASPLILSLTGYMALEDAGQTLMLGLPASVTGALMLTGPRPSWDLFIWPTSTPDSAIALAQGRVTLDLNTTAV